MPYAFTDLQIPSQLEALPDRGKQIQQNIPFGMCNNVLSFALGSFAFPAMCLENALVDSMKIWVSVASGNMRVGIWDAVGVLVGTSDIFTPTVGINTVPLFAEYQLVGGDLYYFGFYTSDNSSTLKLVGTDVPYVNIPAQPWVAIYNGGDVDQAMSAYSGNSKRPWIAIVGK